MAKTDILAPDMVKMTEGGTVTLECVVTEHDRRRFMTCVTQQNCFSEMVRAAHLSKFGRKLTNLRHGKKHEVHPLWKVLKDLLLWPLEGRDEQ